MWVDLYIQSNDTDVTLLCITFSENLPNQTFTLKNNNFLNTSEIYNKLGYKRADSLIGFHSFSGCDTVGKIWGKPKKTLFSTFLAASDQILMSFRNLSLKGILLEEDFENLESFICQAYSTKEFQSNAIADIRYYMYCKNGIERLPPTTGALHAHIQRAHIQAHIWGQCDTLLINQLNPLSNGYYIENDTLTPLKSITPMAPKELIEMNFCKCKTGCSTGRCSCRQRGFSCTDICRCGDDCENQDDLFECDITSDED